MVSSGGSLPLGGGDSGQSAAHQRRQPSALGRMVPYVALCSAAAAVLVVAGVFSSSPVPSELFGVDAIMPTDSYGPVGIKPDAAVEAELKERNEHGSFGKDWGNGELSGKQLQQTLGLKASAKLRSSGTQAALKEYEASQGAKSRLQQLSQSSQPKRAEGHPSEETATSWHPGRWFASRGMGQGLLQSKATQSAIKDLEAHEMKVYGTKGEALKQETARHEGGEALLATKLRGDAGFANVKNRKQALRAIKDLLEEKLDSPAHEQELSSVSEARTNRVREEGESFGERGRVMRGLDKDSSRLQRLSNAIRIRKEDIAAVKDEEHARRDEAEDLQRHAMNLERREMRRYGQAQMARRTALEMAQDLLAEKKKSRQLARKVHYEQKREDQYKHEAEKLKDKGVAEQAQYERLTGPVHKAQQQVKMANEAYTTAELKLAKAETTAEEVARNPKLADEAMARIKKLRAATERMHELVDTTTSRLRSMESRHGPLTGLDSIFQDPKKDAIKKMARARDVQNRVDIFKHKEEQLKATVKSNLPALHKAIRKAKHLHSKYQHLHNEAEREQSRADKAKVAEMRLRRRLKNDRSALDRVKHELLADKSRYSRMA